MEIVIRWRTLGFVVLGAGLLALVTLSPSIADGQKDNSTDNVRPVPPKGVAVAEADVKELKAGLDELQKAIDELKGQALLPDVEIFHKAVRYAVEQGHTVFVVSWRNVGPEQGHLDWDDYIETGVLKAFDVAKAGARAWASRGSFRRRD